MVIKKYINEIKQKINECEKEYKKEQEKEFENIKKDIKNKKIEVRSNFVEDVYDEKYEKAIKLNEINGKIKFIFLGNENIILKTDMRINRKMTSEEIENVNQILKK